MNFSHHLDDLHQQVRDLSQLVEHLKQEHEPGSASPPQPAHETDTIPRCRLPHVPERQFDAEVSPDRARLIRTYDKKWVNGTQLRYYLFSEGPYAGSQAQMDIVREGFQRWREVGMGVSFEETDSLSEAELRIGFVQGDGAWSYVGRDAIDLAGQNERTMNFGWDLTQDPRGADTAVHEIGHALGFPHEHQNPFAGIVWDEEAVYNFFAGAPNYWSREVTYQNVLKKLPRATVGGSEWDPDSVMHYPFPAGLIEQPAQYQDGISPAPGLSRVDREEARRFYPPQAGGDEGDDDGGDDGGEGDSLPRLAVMELEKLLLTPGEQADFLIVPPRSDTFNLRTFGQSDVVMVLFEAVDGQWRYLAGDDDSGSRRNASLQLRLRKGRRYALRIRMYSPYASGETAVLLW